MSIRVYALSKEVGVPSKTLLEYCRLEGIDVSSHASTLTESEAGKLRARVEAETKAQTEGVAQADESPAEAAPSPHVALPPRTKPGQLAFAPKRRAIRPHPPTEAVLPGAPAEEPKAEAEEPAEAVAEVQADVAPESPVVEVLQEPAETIASVEGEPTIAESEPNEPVDEAPAAEAVAEKEPVSSGVDDFVIDIPKAVGRIEGIVPKEIPPRRKGRKGKEKESEKGQEKKPAARSHPQAMGLSPENLSALGEAGRKAREVASRAIREKQGQAGDSQKGLVADTNRPKAGRSASAGGRRRRAADETVEPDPESEERKVARPQKKGSQGRREKDRVDLDADVNVLGTGHVRLERGESVRRPLGERRRRVRTERKKRADEAAAKGHAVEIEEPITVKSLCSAIGVQAGPMISHLMRRGMMISINEAISAELAEEVAVEFGVELKVKAALDIEEAIKAEVDAMDGPTTEPHDAARAPVVTFLGHVDHGKTSLMDCIRSTHVVDGESGGITQHIGAYHVDIGERGVTFLDTPGHEAFTAMRARGAKVTDIVVLVVAADDGIMPQTEEAINHARAAEVPIVVALNKVDLPNANVQRVLGQLAERDLVPEQWGGKTIVVETSATTGLGIDTLLESLQLEAELLELKADPTRPARGAVIEAEMREGLGAVLNLLVQDGVLRVGDILLGGLAVGRVRAMTDDKGRTIDEAGPSMPVSVSGLSVLPDAGDQFYVFKDLQKAREFADQRHVRERQESLATRKHVTLEDLFEQMEAQEVSELRVIIKADVQGSVEVLKQSVGDFKHPEVKVKVLHAAVGAINESDVLLADASDAVVIGFHVIVDTVARALAEQKGVDIRLYSVIYQVLDDLKMALEGMLAPETKQEIVGHVVVRQTFKVSRLGTIAGCYVTDGVIRRTNTVRVSRQGVVVHEGQLDSLKRFKDDGREVSAGMECGLKLIGFDDVKIDDVIEAIQTVQIKRKL
ncbi:MAG: translation initiation factor IF-2 [Planctomycetes bacterium]|nr:translation initiation factor IF-2 [Planctomycetota bacterium]